MNLFVDTSNWNLIILLEQDDKIVDSFIKKGTKKVSDIMVDSIKKLLKKNNITIKDIKRIYVTTGPGSYTGVRIALTMARTLKTLDNSYEVFTIDSLLYQAGMNKAISILDARGKKDYIAVYENGISVLEPDIVLQSEVSKTEKMYPDFKVVKDYEGLDFEKNYLGLKPKFTLVDNVEDLKPIYLKDAIQN